MTKAEEMNLLRKIAELIESAGKNSYIAMTFSGIVEVCERNIEDDFGDCPVEDCANMRVAFDSERRMHEETKRMLKESDDALNKAMLEIESLKSQVRNLGEDSARLAEEKDTIAECLEGMHGICDEQDREIRKLKAEIVRMRMERMDENAMAYLYDKMNEED